MIMNASEKATNLAFVSKIATIINLFQASFTDSTPDLTPWADDPITKSTINPNSIDIGFHFPCRSQLNPHHTLLLQIHLQPKPDKHDDTLCVAGLEISSHSFCGCLWEFSTLRDWRLGETTGLSPEYQAQIKSFCQDVLGLFNKVEYSGHFQGK
jgi:hypothetical protein